MFHDKRPARNLCVYGADKVWDQLNKDGIRVARCTVERLMADMGLHGCTRGRLWIRTTVGDGRGLDDAAYGPGGTYDVCFEGGARPSLLVPISGCHYEYEGNEFGFDPVAYSDQGVEIVLVVGTEDTVCEPWQSHDATAALNDAGYSAELIEVDGGNHANVVFYEIVNDEWIVVPDDPIGQEVVDIILDAIDTDH